MDSDSQMLSGSEIEIWISDWPIPVFLKNKQELWTEVFVFVKFCIPDLYLFLQFLREKNFTKLGR